MRDETVRLASNYATQCQCDAQCASDVLDGPPDFLPDVARYAVLKLFRSARICKPTPARSNFEGSTGGTAFFTGIKIRFSEGTGAD